MLGTERRILLSPAERRRAAYHEAGHALVGMLIPGADPVRKVSIIPRGIALGVTLSAPEADRFSYDRAYLIGKIKVALGGRVAEELMFDEVTQVSPATLQLLDEEVRHLVDDVHEQVTHLLSENRQTLDARAVALLERMGSYPQHAGGQLGCARRAEAQQSLQWPSQQSRGGAAHVESTSRRTPMSPTVSGFCESSRTLPRQSTDSLGLRIASPSRSRPIPTGS